MDNKSIIPFNLEAFKAGQKALTRDGRTATFIAVCEYCSTDFQLIVLIEDNHKPSTCGLDGRYTKSTTQVDDYDLVSMVSCHQSLIDSYDPEDTWQASSQHGEWETIVAGEPMWFESSEYRIHQHNDLIKALKNGAKIECKHKGEDWHDASSDDIWSWYEEAEYRIKPEEPETKTIYEWMVKGEFGYWHLNGLLLTEDEAAKEFAEYEYKKTGRDWKVEV